MRKLLLGFFLLATTFTLAQDLQSVQSSIASNDYINAKKQIDNYFLDKKSNAEPAAWYYKGRVYTEVVRQYEKGEHEILQEAFKAYKRYQELDQKNKLMQLNDNVDLFQLYDLSYNTAADFYNERNYDLAYNLFRTALEVQEYIRKKGFSFQGKTFPVMDTSLINLTGSAAYLSNKEGEAVPYFERLANARIGGEDYRGVYALLYQHYTKRNDQAKATKFLNTGKELYPDHEYWIKMEMGNVVEARQRFARYDQLVQKYPADLELQLNYAIELYNYTYAEPQPADYENRQSRLQTLLARVLVSDSNSVMGNFIMSQHVYNQVYDMEELMREMKEDTQAEQTKKKTFSAKLDLKYEELLKYSLKAHDLYSVDIKSENRDSYRKVLNQLIAYYQKRKQGDRVNYYQERLRQL